MTSDIKKTICDIKNLKIQGATSVFRATALALQKYGLKNNFKNRKDFLNKIEKIGKMLAYARPTEPLAQNGLKFFLFHLKKSQIQDVVKLKTVLKEKIDWLVKQVDKNKKKIVGYGAKLINNGDNIFTHCHSHTVEKIIVEARKRVKKIKVFNTETRPLFQGRITSKMLLQEGIDVSMVADSFAPFLISRYSGKDLMMDKIFLGGDLITEDGSIINKIGSFGIGLTAYYEKVPIYVAVHLLKFNPFDKFEIEKRSGKELWPNAPKDLKIINYAFDIVLAKFITGIITEFGLINPKDVKGVVKEKYPWLFLLKY